MTISAIHLKVNSFPPINGQQGHKGTVRPTEGKFLAGSQSVRSIPQAETDNFSENDRLAGTKPVAVTAPQADSAQKPAELAYGHVANTIAKRAELTLRKMDGKDAEGRDTSNLSRALNETFAYLEEVGGKKLATTGKAILLQHTAGGATEDNIAEGMSRLFRIVDNQLGQAQGDQFVGFLNSTVNDALNSVFQNGKTELFHIAGQSPQGTMSGPQQTAIYTTLAANQAQTETSSNPIEDLIGETAESMTEELEKMKEKKLKNAMHLSVAAYTATEAAPAGALLAATA
ncbi:MAG: hypothetical protein ACNI27_00600 [Desulfovibrio sp.]